MKITVFYIKDGLNINCCVHANCANWELVVKEHLNECDHQCLITEMCGKIPDADEIIEKLRNDKKWFLVNENSEWSYYDKIPDEEPLI